MPLSPARSWTLFRAFRVLIYSIASLASMGIAAIYAVLLIRGWYSYSVEQRAIIITLLVIYAVSTVMMYSMLIFRFRLWLDGARLVLLILTQVGGTVAFDLFYPSFPCANLGTVSTCKMVETVAIFGGWSLSGLLLLFGVYLAAMHYVPVPVPRQDPEAILALQLSSEKYGRMAEKHNSIKSMASASSVYSQQTRITPYPYTAPLEVAKPRRSPSIPESTRSAADNQYRFQTPAYIQPAVAPKDQYRSEAPVYMQVAESPKDQYRSQTPVYMQSPVSAKDQYRSQTPGYTQSKRPQYTSSPDMERLTPRIDDNRSRTPGSLRSTETTVTLGSHINRPALAYDYSRSRTPGPTANLSLPPNNLAPTYDYNHSRTPGSSGSTESNSSRGSHNARIPPFGHYRSVTPAISVRSVALTSASSIRTAPGQRYYQNNGIPAPKPLLAAPDRNHSPLTQAFTEPISRQGTPMSSLSNTSFYMPQSQQLNSPPGLAPVGPGYNFPQPPSANYPNGSPTSPLSQPPREWGRSDSSAPYSARSSDAVLAYLSESVPRSPSPETVSFHNMPTTPLSAILPARPDLSPALYIGRYGSPVPEAQRERYGSVPGLNMNDSPVLGNEHYVAGDYGRASPNRNWTASPPDDRVGSIGQWRKNMTYTPRPLEGRRI